jgi:N12 class adenine-specific DNA methylase
MIEDKAANGSQIEFEGALYHVIARGNHRRDIFRDEADRGDIPGAHRALSRAVAVRLSPFVFSFRHR